MKGVNCFMILAGLSKHRAKARTQGLTGKKDKNNSRYTKLIPAREKVIILHKNNSR